MGSYDKATTQKSSSEASCCGLDEVARSLNPDPEQLLARRFGWLSGDRWRAITWRPTITCKTATKAYEDITQEVKTHLLFLLLRLVSIGCSLTVPVGEGAC